MAAMIRRTIKPAEADSKVSAEEAASAARLVYRDPTTGRFVILENDLTIRHRSQKRPAKRAYPRDAAGHTKGSEGHSSSERRSAKKQ
jgi:hypothetical protein